MKWSAEDAARSAGGRVVKGNPGRVARGVSSDSRSLTPGQGFVALAGARFDGHEFVCRAAERGAAWVMVGRNFDAASVPGPAAVIAVDDPLEGLGSLAAAWRRQFKVKVAAVTGSIGKSTTKEMIAAVLSSGGRVLKNNGNLNNRIGLPQTLFNLTAAHDFAVLEMGTNEPGEIGKLTRIAAPDAGLITRVAPAHLEGLGSLDGVARAKAEMIRGLSSEAVFILNLDDPRIVAKVRGFAGRVIGFSGRDSEDFGGESLHLLSVGKEVNSAGPQVVFQVQRRRAGKKAGRPVEFRLGCLGRHNAMNALAAAAMGRAFGVELAEAAARLRNLKGLSNRGEVARTRRGVFVVNDSYNASPEAVAEALASVAWWKGPRRGVAVLGEMLELGSYTKQYHREVGRRVAEAGMELLIARGPSAGEMAAAAVEAGLAPGSALAARDNEEAARLLHERLRKGDWVLVKGSRAMGLESVVAAIAR